MSVLDRINSCLPEQWEACTTQGERIYYINHHTQTTQWLPPQDSWKSSDNNGLPYGWETGVTDDGKNYFINHIEKTTSVDDPRNDPDYIEPPQPREALLTRHTQMGFGFVAGSEKPVIVRFVTEGGPSEDKLLPGDQILKINDEDVAKAPRERVIELVRSCEETITIVVCQPQLDNSARKSALLTAAKKARLKNHPIRVRFAEAVIVNGAAVISPSTHESYIPFMPNVLKVFLENGQTKSFKYDNKTTVKEVIDSLQEKLNVNAINHFALVLQNTRSSNNKLSIVHDYETLADIAARPDSQHFKCLFRVAFVAKDAYDLLQSDHVSFDYFYTQCTNDVVHERFASDLKYDVALRLAALHIQQHYSASHAVAKLNLKNLERDTGLERFVPTSILDSMKAKEVRKLLNHYMKLNQNLAPGQKQLTELQAKLHYLKILSQLKAFGGKCFVATFVEKKTEVMIVVGPRRGIAEVTHIKTNTFTTVAKFNEIEYMTLTKENDSMQQILLHLVDTAPMVEVTFSMLNDDIEEFIALVEGYYRLFVNVNRSLLTGDQMRNNNQDSEVPSYNRSHNVLPNSWNYADKQTTNSDTKQENEAPASVETEGVKTEPETATDKVVDLSRGPPPYGKQTLPEGSETEDVEEKEVIYAVIQKPDTLQVELEASVTAPLASPDVSTLSGSESSVLPQTPDQETDISTGVQESWLSTDQETDISTGVQESWLSTDPEISIDSNSFDDSLSKDSDSVTGSSISTVISASKSGNHDNSSNHSPDGSTPPAPMSRSLSAQDSRFGVSSFKTFAASPKSSPVLPRSRPSSQPVMGREAKISHMTSIKAELDLKVKGRLRSGDESDAESMTSNDLEKAPLLEGEGHKKEESYESDTDSHSTPTSSPAKHKLTDHSANESTKQEQDRPQSFGLHSPEKPLPGSEDEFKELACSFGLHSPEAVVPTESIHPIYNPRESIHPSYNPRLFSDGQLYFDPEIIDLTMIPPPLTPEEKDNLMDFASPTMTIPPPGFKDTSPERLITAGLDPGPSITTLPGVGPGPSVSSLSGPDLPTLLMDLPTPVREKIDAIVQNEDDISKQMAVIDALLMAEVQKGRDDNEKESGIFESESDSGNETISSENIELGSSGVSDMIGLSSATGGQHSLASFDTLDIDAFIASMTVPPPPRDDIIGDAGIVGAVGGVEFIMDSGKSDSSDSRTPRISRQGTPDISHPSPPPLAPQDYHTSTPNSSTKDPSMLDTSTLDSSTMDNSTLDNSTSSSDQYVNDLLNGKDYSGIELDDEIAKLVMPPPPDSSEMVLVNIPVVPPVSHASTANPEQEMQYLALYNNIVPYDSPTALEGTKLVDSLRAEFEGRGSDSPIAGGPLAGGPSTGGPSLGGPSLGGPSLGGPSLGSPVHERSSSVPDEAASGHDLLRRYTSLDPTLVSSTPVSSGVTIGVTKVSDCDESDVLSYGSPYRRALWRPAEVSKSADSSPLHQPGESLAHSRVHNSIGTLPRILRRKKPAPPPPPRRSSMQPNELPGDRYSDSLVNTRIQHVSHQRSFSVPEDTSLHHGNTSPVVTTDNTHAPLAETHSLEPKNYENIFPKDPARNDYENIVGPSLFETDPNLTKRSLADEVLARTTRLPTDRPVKPDIAAKSATIERDTSGSSSAPVSTFVPGRDNLVSKSITLDRHKVQNLEHMMEVSQSVDNINFQAYKEYKRSSSASSSSDSSSKSNSTDSSRFQAFKSKLKSYVAPSIYKKQQMFNRGSLKNGKSSKLDCDPHKSEYLSSPCPTSPRTSLHHGNHPFPDDRTPSPSHSPLMNRHSSFSDHSDSQSSPKTFRTFLGERTRLSSSGSESAPTSPLRTAGIRTSLPYQRTDIPGLTREQVPGSPKKVLHPTVTPSAHTTNISTSSTEELKSRPDSAVIKQGKVLVKAPSDNRNPHSGSDNRNPQSGSSNNGQTTGKSSPWRRPHSASSISSNNVDSKSINTLENGGSSKVNAIKNELETRLGHRYSMDRRNGDDAGVKDNSDKSLTLQLLAVEIQAKEYIGDVTFSDADRDVDHMVHLLEQVVCDWSKNEHDPAMSGNLKTCKDSLVSYSRTFVTDSKLLVSSATQSKEKLISHVNSSIHTLAKIMNKSAQIVTIMTQREHIELLGSKVKDVARAYKMTVSAAHGAAGKPLSDPNMKMLMKQATSLAAILSSFMKTLKALDTS